MHFLVLGATGPSGLAFLHLALQSNHHLTIFCRNASKLPEPITSSPNIEIFTGSFEEIESVKPALRTGATVLVSFAGPSSSGAKEKGTPITEFYERLFPLVKEEDACAIKRVMVLSTPSFQVSEDRFKISWWLLILFVRLFLGSAYQEVRGMGDVVTKLDVEEFAWTVFRVAVLGKGEERDVRAGFVGEEGVRMKLGRKGLARWVLREVEDGRWVGRCPVVCDL